MSGENSTIYDSISCKEFGLSVNPVAQQAHIADAPGDSTANNATTINAIIDALEAYGLLATS